jgi:signal transduction histidine kinase
VVDDGVGFEPAAVSGSHMGLDIMQERANGIGAELTVFSEPNMGTSVDVMWSDHERD